MSSTAAKIFVLVGEQFACIRISGRANFSSSIDFKTLVNELWQKNYRYFVLDLSECALMDSTFLGVLAGFGLKVSASQKDPCAEGIELLNPNARISELLENLGVIHLFKIAAGPLTLPDQAQAQPLTPTTPTKEEVTRACLEAHQTLMSISPENISRFKEVTAFLAEDLKKVKKDA